MGVVNVLDGFMKFAVITGLSFLLFFHCEVAGADAASVSNNDLGTIEGIRIEQHRLRDTEYRFPVVLEKAVVTYANNKWGVVFIADATGTIHARLPSGDGEPLYAGNEIRIEAVSTSDHPHLLDDVQYEILSDSKILPEAATVTVSELPQHPDNASFVDLTGRVKSVAYAPNFVVLELVENDVCCRVFIGPLSVDLPIRIRVGQIVQIFGAVASHGEFSEPIVYCETDDRLQIVEDAKATPSESMRNVNRDTFDDLRIGESVSIKGRVSESLDADHYTIDTGEVGCRIRSVGGFMVHPGELIQVHGRVAQLGGGLTVNSLRAQTLLFVSEEPSPAETVITRIEDADIFRELIVFGDLLSAKPKGDATELQLRDREGTPFVALLPASESQWLSKRLTSAHSLRIRGKLKPGNPRTLKVASSEDYRIVETKLSFYAKSLLSLLALAATLGTIFCLWTVMLRRTVKKRTVDLENALSRLRDTYVASRAAIAIVNEHGEIIEANSKFAKIVGYNCNPGTEFRTLKQHLATHCENADSLRLWFRQVESDPLAEVTFSVKLTEPKPRFLDVHTSPVLSAEKKLVSRQWAFYDVTETKQLESRLVQSQKMDAIGRLTGGVAHDFNNLLTAIRGNIELAKDASSASSEDQIKYIQSAERAAVRASEIVGQLLSFSRKNSLERKAGNVNSVITEICTLLHHSFGAEAVIKTNLDESLWLTDFDETFIGQVIMNLCLNARDALQDGRGTIFVSTTNLETKGSQYVRINIRDNGHGMDDAILKNIFEPFFTTKEQGKGSGLGLAMSHGIIEQHGGRIACESVVGEGTCFRIDLPKSTQTVETPSDRIDDKRIEAVKQVTTEDGTCTHIIVVDDEEMIRSLAKTILEYGGHQVTVAADGGSALAKISKDETISVALLDLTMPGLSGKETLQSIKQRYPQVAVVLSSGSLIDASEFDDCPPDFFLAKPYRYEDLLCAVRECQKSHNRTAA